MRGVSVGCWGGRWEVKGGGEGGGEAGAEDCRDPTGRKLS